MLLSQPTYSTQEQGATRLHNLELFRMLLQPHFLFNSLNNLYALSLKHSDLTSEAIAGLSDLLEKVVASSQKEYISLGDEVDLIKDYIKLERIWLGETSFLLDLRITGDVDKMKIPPLVLYTFVENCFKHGIRKCGNAGWITIKVEVKKMNLYFTTRNLLPELGETDAEEHACRNGIGVVAATELLENKCCGHYHLDVTQEGNIYGVNLVIEAKK